MSTTTTNYGLIKPDTTDPILIGQLNDNADAIDAALKENADAIENKPDAADIPTPSTAAPAMDGTAAAGTSTDYARADHVHPSDTSKQDTLSAAQLAAVNSGIDSAKVAQIETNKNNILLLTQYGGGKNKLNYTIDTAKALNTSNIYSWSGNTCTVNGITFTFNADKTISASGTIVDSSSNAILSLVSFTGANGDILSAEQTGNAYIYLRGGNTNTASVLYRKWDSGDVGVARIVAIVVINTAGTLNVKFKPMVSTEADYNASSSYQPYAMSNAELTAAIQAIQAQLAGT